MIPTFYARHDHEVGSLIMSRQKCCKKRVEILCRLRYIIIYHKINFLYVPMYEHMYAVLMEAIKRYQIPWSCGCDLPDMGVGM